MLPQIYEAQGLITIGITPEQKAAKKKRREEYMTVFMNGKQKRIKRPPIIDGMDAEEFIQRNANPIWLHQNEMWEYIEQNEDEDDAVDKMLST
ncbi:MAG: hypothetical protein ACYST5_21130 [Planctomycetota bacterium]|jgi:hypothetical protein